LAEFSAGSACAASGCAAPDNLGGSNNAAATASVENSRTDGTTARGDIRRR